MVVHMRDAVTGKHVAVQWAHHTGIPNLHRIAEVMRQLCEKRIEFCDKVSCGYAVALKFEQEGPRVRFEARFSVWREHDLLEQSRIEKPRVGLTGFCAIPGMA